MSKVKGGHYAVLCAALLWMGVSAAADDQVLRMVVGPDQVATARVELEGRHGLSGRQGQALPVQDADAQGR